MSDSTSRSERPTSSSSTGPWRARSRGAATRSPRRRRVPRQRRPGIAQGRPRRRRGGPRRPGQLVERHRLQPRPGHLPPRRDGRVAPRRARRARGAERRAEARSRPGYGGEGGRPYGLVRGLDRQGRPGAGGANPVAGPSSTSRCPRPAASWAWSPPRSPRSRDSSTACWPRCASATRWSCSRASCAHAGAAGR